jgi:sugar phosphate isomerase/epimerase
VADNRLELGMISSTWAGTKVGLEEGIRKTREIGFDSYDVFEDPLDIDDATREKIKNICEEVGLPIRSVVCVAFGIVDFNPSVVRFTMDRVRAYIDQGAFFGARNVLLVIGSTSGTARSSRTRRSGIWPSVRVRNSASTRTPGASSGHRAGAFSQALVKDVDVLVRFIREVDHPAVKANADISHLHLSDASFEDVEKLEGMIGHIHLSDCDGEVHGDLPPGRGVTPIKEYLEAIADTGYSGTVSLELEYSPDPDRIVEWVEEAYTETAKIMADLGVRDGAKA